MACSTQQYLAEFGLYKFDVTITSGISNDVFVSTAYTVDIGTYAIQYVQI